MKTLSYAANKSVPWRNGTWRITVKDNIALKLWWYFESGSYVQTSFDCYVFTLLTRMIDILTFEIW